MFINYCKKKKIVIKYVEKTIFEDFFQTSQTQYRRLHII